MYIFLTEGNIDDAVDLYEHSKRFESTGKALAKYVSVLRRRGDGDKATKIVYGFLDKGYGILKSEVVHLEHKTTKMEHGLLEGSQWLKI